MDRNQRFAFGGVAAAIAVTTVMDARGLAAFSALPLFPIGAALWAWQRFSRADIGLVAGRAPAYVLALAHPTIVLGSIALIAYVAGAVDSANTDWGKALTNVALMGTVGVVMGLITEEGFFRGWLWACLRRAGHSQRATLVWTTLAFTLWHVSAITLDTGFDVPARQVPVYLINATLLGAVWGMLRMASGSIVVASVAHAVWNGLDYPLFGFGERSGALGIEATHVFGPEVGLIGVGVNLVAAAALWRFAHRRSSEPERA